LASRSSIDMSQLPFLLTRMDDDRSVSKKDNAWSS
jgi:hypothetical protein